MKKICLLMIMAIALPALASAQDWSNVSIVDTQCSAKAKADPDSHTRDCALTCAKSGFGILDKDGNYLRFDEKGNQEALKLLQSTSKKDHLRVNVTGSTKDGVIYVRSVKLS